MVEQQRQGRRWARMAMILFIAVGALLWSWRSPQDLRLRFEVPPVVRVQDQGVPRTALRGLVARVLDVAGEEQARISLDFPGGMEGPLTAPAPLRLRKGVYGVDVVVRTSSRVEVRRRLRLEVDGERESRLSLE